MYKNIEVGKTFMYATIEYRITYINEKKKRINVELIEKENSKFPVVGQKIKMDNYELLVTYVNSGKNLISLE